MTDIERDKLREIVISEMDACGYFISDCDSEIMRKSNPNWKPNSEKTFGEILMDFAVQYNMEEEGKHYVYHLAEPKLEKEYYGS